ncbi:hypothetical protein LXL04_035586 [Taraxacum kok-saghyz]
MTPQLSKMTLWSVNSNQPLDFKREMFPQTFPNQIHPEVPRLVSRHYNSLGYQLYTRVLLRLRQRVSTHPNSQGSPQRKWKTWKNEPNSLPPVFNTPTLHASRKDHITEGIPQFMLVNKATNEGDEVYSMNIQIIFEMINSLTPTGNEPASVPHNRLESISKLSKPGQSAPQKLFDQFRIGIGENPKEIRAKRIENQRCNIISQAYSLMNEIYILNEDSPIVLTDCLPETLQNKICPCHYSIINQIIINCSGNVKLCQLWNWKNSQSDSEVKPLPLSWKAGSSTIYEINML